MFVFLVFVFFINKIRIKTQGSPFKLYGLPGGVFLRSQDIQTNIFPMPSRPVPQNVKVNLISEDAVAVFVACLNQNGFVHKVNNTLPRNPLAVSFSLKALQWCFQ